MQVAVPVEANRLAIPPGHVQVGLEREHRPLLPAAWGLEVVVDRPPVAAQRDDVGPSRGVEHQAERPCLARDVRHRLGLCVPSGAPHVADDGSPRSVPEAVGEVRRAVFGDRQRRRGAAGQARLVLLRRHRLPVAARVGHVP